MKKSICALLVTGCIAASGAVQAEIIADSFTNGFETTEINQTGSLAMFDETLGTLDSLILTLSGESISQTNLLNTSSGNQTFSYNSALDFLFDLSSVNQTTPDPTFTTILATTGGRVNLAIDETMQLGPTNDGASYEMEILGADLAAFIGSAGDTFELGCQTFTESRFSGGGGNISNVQVTTAFCAADIVYNYTADVPVQEVAEPASLWLFGASMLGLAGFSRRKSRK